VSRTHWQGTKDKSRIETLSAGIPSRDVGSQDLTPVRAVRVPLLVTTENGCHVVMGQRKWKVQGGFPHLYHGGLSLIGGGRAVRGVTSGVGKRRTR